MLCIHLTGHLDVFSWTVSGLDILQAGIVPIAIIAGLLLIVEGMLIQKHGAAQASPKLVTTDRGIEAIVYHVKRLWLLPILLVIPGEVIPTYLPYWPQFTLRRNCFFFVCISICNWFPTKISTFSTDSFFPGYGKIVWQLGIVITIIAAIGYFEPLVSAIAILIGVIARLLITIIKYQQEKTGNYAVSPQSNGVMIAGVLSGFSCRENGSSNRRAYC